MKTWANYEDKDPEELYELANNGDAIAITNFKNSLPFFINTLLSY